MIRPLAVLVVAAAPAWSADFAERWPQPVAVDPAPAARAKTAGEAFAPSPAGFLRPSNGNAGVKADICTRHHLHKVITRGGKSWRCQR